MQQHTAILLTYQVLTDYRKEHSRGLALAWIPGLSPTLSGFPSLPLLFYNAGNSFSDNPSISVTLSARDVEFIE